MQLFEVDVLVTELHSDNGNVPIELFPEENLRYSVERAGEIHKRSGDVEALREFQADRLSALDLDLSPDEFLHSVLVLDPRAAGLAPAWGTCDGHLHIKAVREVDGVLESVLPFRGHIYEPLVHNLRGLKAGVEVVESYDSGLLHPQKVFLDSVLGDVSVHPVPPHPRAGGLRRILELLVEILPGR